MRKHFLILMLMALLPLAGFAQMSLTSGSEQTVGNIKYKVLSVYQTEDFNNNKVNTVSAQQNNFTAEDLVIPATVKFDVKGTSTDNKAIDGSFEFKVVTIEAAESGDVGFKANTNIKTVTIGSDGKTYVKTIEQGAFEGSKNIESVTFLPYSAYQKNAGTQEFGANIFKGTKIATLNLQPTTLATINNYFGTSYASSVNNATLTEVTLPSTWTLMAASAFENCTKLATVNFTTPTLANDVYQTVNSGAFLGCPITELDMTKTKIQTIPSTMLVNGTNVVYNAKTVKVIMPATLTTIEASAFNGCVGLEDVDFSKANLLTKIGDYAFGTTPSLTAINLSGATSLEVFTTAGYQTPFIPAAGKKNTELTTITLPTAGKVNNVSKSFKNPGTALANLAALTTINGFTTVTNIDNGAFANDAALASLSFPNTLTTIAGSPFEGCTSLSELTFDGKALTTFGTTSTQLYGATADVLKSLTITNDVIANFAAGILTNQSDLATVKIAEGREIKSDATLNAGAIWVKSYGSVTLGKISVNASGDGFISAGIRTEVSIGVVNAALTKELVSGTVDVTVAGINDYAVSLDAFSKNARTLTFTGEIKKAMTAYASKNNNLRTIECNKIKMPENTFPSNMFSADRTVALTINWNPADGDAKKAFAKDAFKSSSATTPVVTLNTTTKVAGLYDRSEANLYNVKFVAAVVTVDIALENNGEGSYYYAKFFGAGDYKIAKATEDGKKVIVYGAYVDDSDNTVYMEQLHIINGFYYVPANVPVIVKSEAEATKALSAAGESKSSMNMISATNYVSELNYLEAETVGTALMNLTTDKDWNKKTPDLSVDNTNFDLYALAKISKYNITWKTFKPATTLPVGTFYVRKNKSASAPEMLNVVWTDGSEENLTGIDTVKAAEQQFDGAIYTIQGVRVSAPQKGQIYIQNGKKFMMK